MNQQVLNHLEQQLANADAWVESWVRDINGKELPARHMLVKTRQYVDDFMAGRGAKRWVIMPGLRESARQHYSLSNISTRDAKN
jgi:hypothetical protein